MTAGAVQVGEVEVLRAQVYPLDPEMGAQERATRVWVEPGRYPLYRLVDVRYWVMTGRVNARGFQKLGDGLFAANEFDGPAGPEVTFPSPTFGPRDWKELLAQPRFTEGHPEQRIRFHLTPEETGCPAR